MSEQVKPFVKCVDYWPCYIPPDKLEAYRQLIDEGQIMRHTVIYGQNTGGAAIEYYAIAPHEWILDELKKRSEAYARQSMPMP